LNRQGRFEVLEGKDIVLLTRKGKREITGRKGGNEKQEELWEGDDGGGSGKV
jgi:hypothetical protein